MGRPKKNKEIIADSNEDSNVATLDPETIGQENTEKTISEVTPVTENITEVKEQNTISVLDRVYDRLFTEGSLVSVHISRWGMAAKLSESDLEIEKVPEIIHLGKKMLMKPVLFNQFAQLEQKARTYLKKSSNKFPISQAHFVSSKNLPEVRVQLRAYKEEFNLLVESFIENYETNKAEALAAYPAYADKLRTYYPPVGELQSKFSFDFAEFRINMPKEFEQVNVRILLGEEQRIEELTAETKARLEEEAAKQLDQITNFVGNSIKELRAEMDSIFAVIVNKINKGEVVSDVNKNTLLRKIQEFEKMNIFGDKTMADQITAVKGLLQEDRDYKNKEDATDREVLRTFLQDAMEVAQSTTDISSLTGEYFRALEI